jgi:hypothetical protein
LRLERTGRWKHLLFKKVFDRAGGGGALALVDDDLALLHDDSRFEQLE